ncbi:MAG TPA: hypothetical protein VEA99_06670 [Gemmatimonadaceae bacterium]|nr:hypothetical protein [Gemmatimonadaceae bacterium]
MHILVLALALFSFVTSSAEAQRVQRASVAPAASALDLHVTAIDRGGSSGLSAIAPARGTRLEHVFIGAVLGFGAAGVGLWLGSESVDGGPGSFAAIPVLLAGSAILGATIGWIVHEVRH